MKYFIFAMIFILSTPDTHAQNFFMPSNALSTAQDKLKPLPDTLPDYRQRRYKVVDGHVILLPDEPLEEDNNAPAEINEEVKDVSNIMTENLASVADTESKKSSQESLPPLATTPILSESESVSPSLILSDTPQQESVPLHEPTFLKPSFLEDDDQSQIIMPEPEAPEVEEFDDKQPTYKNRYAQYVNDLKTFQKTGKLPRNKEIENTLKKLTKPREVILFNGEVE